MSLLSTADVADLRVTLGELLAHRFDYTPHVVTVDPETERPVEDDWGSPVVEDGTPVEDAACLYRPTERLRVDEGGPVTISEPSLLVAHDSALAVGDTVTNLRDADGTVLLAGPLTVEAIEPSAGLGAAVWKRVTLRAGDVR